LEMVLGWEILLKEGICLKAWLSQVLTVLSSAIFPTFNFIFSKSFSSTPHTLSYKFFFCKSQEYIKSISNLLPLRAFLSQTTV
jgi:hypothetical protein